MMLNCLFVCPEGSTGSPSSLERGQSWLLLALVPLRDGVSGKPVKQGPEGWASSHLWFSVTSLVPSAALQLEGRHPALGSWASFGGWARLVHLEKAGLVPRDLSRTWRWSVDPSRIGRVRTESHVQVEGHVLCARTSSSQPWVVTRHVLSKTRTLC